MKRLMSIILIAVAMLSFTCEAKYESKPKFKYEWIIGLDGYEYNKYDRIWVFSKIYREDFKDISFDILLISTGTKDSVDLVRIGIMYYDNGYLNKDSKVNRIDFAVGETLYTFTKPIVNDSIVAIDIGIVAEKLIKAMSTTNEVVGIRITFSDEKVEFDLDKNKFNSTLKYAAKVLIDKKIIAGYGGSKYRYDYSQGASILE